MTNQHNTASDKQEGWREIYDEKVAALEIMYTDADRLPPHARRCFIADFIASVEEEARREEREKVLSLVKEIRPNQNGEGLSIFKDPHEPFVWPKESRLGENERKLFALGYLQAKKDISGRVAAIESH